MRELRFSGCVIVEITLLLHIFLSLNGCGQQVFSCPNLYNTMDLTQYTDVLTGGASMSTNQGGGLSDGHKSGIRLRSESRT